MSAASPPTTLRASAAPYTGWAGFNSSHGLPRAQVKELLLHCAANDIRAVMMRLAARMLDLYEEVDREIPLKGRRWVISHISMTSPREIERIARMGLVLTTHTNNYLYKGLDASLRSACRRSAIDDIMPLRSLREAGVKVSLATDNVPVSLFLPISQSDRAHGLPDQDARRRQRGAQPRRMRCAAPP